MKKDILLIIAIVPSSVSSEKGEIRSKSTSQSYRDNWDLIFGKNKAKDDQYSVN